MPESICELEKNLPLWELEKSYLGREPFSKVSLSPKKGNSLFYSSLVKTLQDCELFETFLKSMLTTLEKSSTATHHDLASAFQKLTILLVLSSHFSIQDCYRDRFIELIRVWKENQFLENDQLFNAMHSLCSFLACAEAEPYSLYQFEFGGALPHWGYQSDGSNLFLPQQCSELAVISSILAFLHKDKELYFSSMKLVEFHLHLLDARKKPIKAMFTRESNYSSTNEQLLSSCLKAILSKDSQEVDMASIASQKCFYSMYLQCLKSILFPLLKETTWSFKPQILLQDHNLGFAIYEYNDFNAFTTICGNNSGLGSISKGDAQIIAFGPQKAPLYDMSSFGIMRTLDIDSESLDDVECTQDSNSLLFQGWARFFSSNTESLGKLEDRWLQLTTDIKKDKCNLSLRLYDNMTFDDYYICFYVKADTITLDGSSAVKGGLDSHIGNYSHLALNTSESTLHIKSLFESEVRIIPLSGQSAFYGADFLVSYKINFNSPEFIWDIY